jgi:hypothetical protein
MSLPDFALNSLQWAHRTMQIDEAWTEYQEGGFSWWAQALRQQIFVDGPWYDPKRYMTVWRLNARTDLLTGVPEGPRLDLVRSAIAHRAPMYAPYYAGDGRVQLHCSTTGVRLICE